MAWKSYEEKVNNRYVDVTLKLHRWQHEALLRLRAESGVPMATMVRNMLHEPLVDECLARLGVHAEELVKGKEAG